MSRAGLLALLVVSATACATPPRVVAQGGANPAASPTAPFTRRVAPFPVADRDGHAFAEPFLGGFDVPRPQLVDIDGDGDLDLFVQERSNALMFFERTEGGWRWRSDRFLDLPIGEWYRFADLDGDGLVDLLAESPVSHIRAWRNVGTRTAPRFEIAADSLRDGAGYPIPADRQNILAVADIDCNGRLDLFLGRVAGTVDRYEATEAATPGNVPRFALHTERFEDIEIVGPVPGMPDPAGRDEGGSRHGANTLALGDIDGDGDPDLFWGDYFEEGLLLIENRAVRCATPDLRGVPRRFPDSTSLLTSGYNAPALGDVDGDGRLDLVMGVIGGAYGPRTTAIENLWLVTQPAAGRFEVVSRRLLPTIDVGSDAVPALGDLDGDGDADLLIGNRIATTTDATAELRWWENVGTATAPSFRERDPLPPTGEFHYAPAVADLDGDGLADLVVGTFRDRVQWWRNAGTRGAPRFVLADTALVTITRGSNTAPALADLDGDGDLDLVVGESSGQINLYRNDGTRTAPRFVLVSDAFGGIDVGRRSAPAFADVDGDGRPDLLLGREEGGVWWWRNEGAGEAIAFAPTHRVLVETANFSTPAVADVDGDGEFDLVVGTAAGGVFWFTRSPAR